MNWNDPVERAALITRVGAEEYARLQRRHHEATTVAVINGYPIRPVSSRFGRLFSVDGTGKAFTDRTHAERYATSLPDRRTA